MWLKNFQTNCTTDITVDGEHGNVAPDLVNAVNSLWTSGVAMGDLNSKHSFRADIDAETIFNTERGFVG